MVVRTILMCRRVFIHTFLFIEKSVSNTNTGRSDENNVNEVNNHMDEEVVVNIEENVNEVEANVFDQGNNNFQGLENLSVAEALAFFSL